MIDKDTILFVIGDHGMTANGDHGGDSLNEVTSALFAFSPGLKKQHFSPISVPQVSFAPTLSLLLGVPIPFSSIGSSVTELFKSDLQITSHTLNVEQVHHYLTHYNKKGNPLPKNMWKNLNVIKSDLQDLEKNASAIDFEHYKAKYKNLLSEITSLNDSKILLNFKRKLHLSYLSLVKAMCEEVWATFNVNEMVGGILLLIVSLVNMVTIALSVGKITDTLSFFVKGNLAMIFVIAFSITLKHLSKIIVLNYIPALLSGFIVVFHFSRINSIAVYGAYKDIIPILIYSLLCFGNFSNSFVINEDTVSAFIVVTLFGYQTIKVLFAHRVKILAKDCKIVSQGSALNYAQYASILAFVVCCVAVRCSQILFRCREEQINCQDFGFYKLLSTVDPALKNSRYFVGLFALFLIVYIPRTLLIYCGNLNGLRPSVLALKYSGYVCVLLISSFWALEAVPKPSDLILFYINFPPRFVYIIALVVIGTLLLKPLMIFQLKKNNGHSYHPNSLLIPELFNSLKSEYNNKINLNNDTPVVYGLATSLSAPILGLVTTVMAVVAMVTGPSITPALITILLTMSGCCLLHAVLCWQQPTVDSVLRLRWVIPIMWTTLSLQSFYALGHQMTLNTIPWLAAFVGFVANEPQSVDMTAIRAILVLFHTYSSHILFGLSLPLVILSPFALSAIVPSLRKNFKADELVRGEFILAERPESLVGSLTASSVVYIALHALRVLFSCISGLFLKRHLMLWKVFAPHFIFEALGLLVSMASVLGGLFFSFRVLNALIKWASDISLLKVKPL